MKISNITRAELDTALERTNIIHGYRLIWNAGNGSPRKLNAKGTRWQVTIRSAVSKVRGARLAASGRNLVSASWHAHGHFFEQVFIAQPGLDGRKAPVIRTGNAKITGPDRARGNWQDRNVGSQYCPAAMSSLSVF